MKNRVKLIKMMLLAILTATILLCTTGCAKMGECNECRQTTKVEKYVKQGRNGNLGDAGEVIYLCEDCMMLAKILGY